MLDIGLEDTVTELFTRRVSGLTVAVARRKVDHLLIGGGLAAGELRALAARGGRRGLDPARGARARPAVQPPAAVEGLPARRGVARGRAVPPGRVVGRAGHRAAHAHERDEARHRRAAWPRSPPRRRSSSARRCSPPAPTCAACAPTAADLDGHPLPARVRRTRTRSARTPTTRERVVLIGGSYIGCEVAASLTAAHGVHCTIVMQEDVTLERALRRGGGRLLPGRARGARGRGARRRRARALRGRRRARDQGRDEGRAGARLRLRRDRARA